jgi:hypothetical protein
MLMIRILDNLPVAIKRQRHDLNSFYYERGFPVGFSAKLSDTGVRKDFM